MAEQMFSKCSGIRVVDVVGESVCCPLLLAVQLSKDKIADRVPVILGVFPGYHWAVAVYLY